MGPRVWAVGGTTIAVVWAGALLATPWFVRAAPPGARRLAAVVYLVGGTLCHQRPDRSFHLRGVQLPVCARCTGLYLASAFGALAAWTGGRRPRRVRRSRRGLVVAAALPTMATWIGEGAGLAVAAAVRAAAAVPFGAAVAWVVVASLLEEATDRDKP